MGVQTVFRAYADVITNPLGSARARGYIHLVCWTLRMGWKTSFTKEHCRIYVLNQYSILSVVLPAS